MQENYGLRHIISSRAADKMLPGHGNSEDNGEIFAQPRADKMLPGHGNSEDNGEIFAQPRAEREMDVWPIPHTHSIDPTDRQTDRQNCTQRRTTRDRYIYPPPPPHSLCIAYASLQYSNSYSIMPASYKFLYSSTTYSTQ